MKKTITLFAAMLIMASAFAQTNPEKEKTKLKPYASIGISIGHVDLNDANIDNFNKASYPSVELGIMGENLSLGAVVGVENIFASSTTRGFYELKTAISKPIGKCSGYALFGVGAYMENGFNNFIEYGAGFSYMPNKIGYFAQYSNWARTNYISLGLTFGF